MTDRERRQSRKIAEAILASLRETGLRRRKGELVAPEGLACFARWGIFHGNADFFCNIIVVHSLDLLKKCGTQYQEK